MKRNPLSRWLFSVLLLSAAAGCTTARMAIPADLEARADVYPCVGRGGFAFGETFTFGPYEVFNVRRGWTHRVAWSIAPYERARARQQYEFSLRMPSGRRWHGQAATGVRKQDLKNAVAGGELTWGLARDVNFVAGLGLANQTNGWTLALAEERGGGPRAQGRRGEERLRAHPRHGEPPSEGGSIAQAARIERPIVIVECGAAPIALRVSDEDERGHA